MFQCRVRINPLLWLEHQHLIQHITQLRQEQTIALTTPSSASCALLQQLHDAAFGTIGSWDDPPDLGAGNWVVIEKGKAHVLVRLKMLVNKPAPLKPLFGKRPLDVHHQLDHLVIRSTREEELTREELVDDTSDAPHVKGGIVFHTQDDLRGPVVP